MVQRISTEFTAAKKDKLSISAFPRSASLKFLRHNHAIFATASQLLGTLTTASYASYTIFVLLFLCFNQETLFICSDFVTILINRSFSPEAKRLRYLQVFTIGITTEVQGDTVNKKCGISTQRIPWIIVFKHYCCVYSLTRLIITI